MIVAGQNFGCGSSREQAASCLKGPGLIVVARGFARIFLQNAINLGLRTIICPDISASEGDELDITPTEIVERDHRPALPDRAAAGRAPGDRRGGRLIPYARQLLVAAQ